MSLENYGIASSQTPHYLYLLEDSQVTRDVETTTLERLPLPVSFAEVYLVSVTRLEARAEINRVEIGERKNEEHG